jgi:protein N-terminal amidase
MGSGWFVKHSHGKYRWLTLISSAAVGTGYTSFVLPGVLPKLSVAICMDLNPWPDSPWTEGRAPTELADYCLNEDVELLVLPCAWLDSGENPGAGTDKSVINYWAHRLRPLFETKEEAGKSKETIVVVANRMGKERGMFTSGDGSSVVMMTQCFQRYSLCWVFRSDEDETRLGAT